MTETQNDQTVELSDLGISELATLEKSISGSSNVQIKNTST